MADYRFEHFNDRADAALYIDGSLQFDTRDEHIYHEALFLPPAALAATRARSSITGLILGGGDGLGLREVLKIAKTNRVDLVDYDHQIVDLARKELSVYNRAALDDCRAHIHIAEASQFLKTHKKSFDYIVADFTYPESLAGCELFTRKFFGFVARRLKRRGIAAFNACSPTRSPQAYWSIFQTISRAGLYPKPLQVSIDSFAALGYGEWGFFLASPCPIKSAELNKIVLPPDCRYLSRQTLLEAMRLESGPLIHGLNFRRTIDKAEDLRALLNTAGIFTSLSGSTVDFSLDAAPEGIGRYFPYPAEYLFFSLSAYWKERIFGIIESWDWDAFAAAVEKNLAGHLSETADGVRALLKKAGRCWENKNFSGDTFRRAFAALLVVIIITNMLCPDNAFAKGYYGSGHYSGDGDTEIALIAAVPSTAFVSKYWLSSAGVPDMAGKYHDKLSFPVGDKSVPAFFALDDNTYLTENGEIFTAVPRTHFFYKVETDHLVLYEWRRPLPVSEFALDGEIVDGLKKNLEVHRKTLAASVEKMKRWLNWSGSANFLVKEIADEKKELAKMEILLNILDQLARNTYIVNYSAPPEEFSVKIAPSLRITREGKVIMRALGGIWIDCGLDDFSDEVLKSVLNDLKPQDPMYDLIVNRLKRR